MDDDRFDETEEFIPLVSDKTEDLGDTMEILQKKVKPMSREERHFNEYDEDFVDIVKRKVHQSHEEDEEDKPHKRKLKKWVYYSFGAFILIIGLIVFLVVNGKMKAENNKKLIEDIKSHYSEYVKVNKDTPIYLLKGKDNKYIETGTIYKGAVIKLEEEKVFDEETKYFHVKDDLLEDYYIPYDTVVKTDKPEIDKRHENYLPFDKAINIEKATLYLNDEKLITVDLGTGLSVPIIINDYEGKYYINYNGMLVGIKKEEIKEINTWQINGKKNQSKITTLAYHRVYDEGDKCTDAYVCIKKENFDKEMKYLSDNNYLTLTLNELYMYLNGNIQVEKAVAITFDDGYLYKAADEVLRKYNLNGTMFVITGDFSDFTPFKELTNLEVQSHTNNMHRNYVCSGGNQGGAILCAGEEKVKEDLLSSIKKLGTEPIGMAFPFYDYNDTAIKGVKAAGFKMAFVGRAGQMGKATPKVTDLYKIPRMTVYDFSLMSFNEWKGYL